jgi:hypothetical protein
MADIEIAWPEDTGSEELCGCIDGWIECSRLVCGMRTTLAKHPGSTHWHVRSVGSPGTLEITVWPAKRQLWVSMRSNRTADWMAGQPEMLSAAIGCLSQDAARWGH